MTLIVPTPHETFDLTMADGAPIRVRRHGNPKGPRLVLCHGNGFAIDMEEIFHAIRNRLGTVPTVGVFHSISAVTSIWHALQYGKRWDALVLFDPALIPGHGLPEHDVARTVELQ